MQKLILLVNLGSPENLSVGAIRKFLRQFLSDKRVVGLSRLIWYPILFGIVLPLRVPKLLRKYTLIWRADGQSPLSHYTQQQASALSTKLAPLSSKIIVDYAYCYGSRSLAKVLASYSGLALSEVQIIPLYPQYSSSTTAVVWDQVATFYAAQNYIPALKFMNSFATHPAYIKALAHQIQSYWALHGQGERLVVSFHSLPVKLIEEGDCYDRECLATYLALCRELGLHPEREAKLCYQSRFGKAKWLEPATDLTICALAKAEIKRIDVICPGFVSDCLETLEEVALQYRALFLEHGGEDLHYIPCLNDSPEMGKLLLELVTKGD